MLRTAAPRDHTALSEEALLAMRQARDATRVDFLLEGQQALQRTLEVLATAAEEDWWVPQKRESSAALSDWSTRSTEIPQVDMSEPLSAYSGISGSNSLTLSHPFDAGNAIFDEPLGPAWLNHSRELGHYGAVQAVCGHRPVDPKNDTMGPPGCKKAKAAPSLPKGIGPPPGLEPPAPQHTQAPPPGLGGAAVENLWLTTLPGLNDHRCQGLADVLCAQDVCPPAEAYPTQVMKHTSLQMGAHPHQLLATGGAASATIEMFGPLASLREEAYLKASPHTKGPSIATWPLPPAK
mmetsp:Transcript_41141/g.94641  ORF Transcript_41141/g.94641 Transcript_41141/m.94641 type:complete len:293 (-) Transcript_41141:124-1002(-)